MTTPLGGRRLPYHTDEDMMRLEARRTVHAGMLPSNHAPGMDGLFGNTITEEASMQGWTAQQPWDHVACPVAHLCVLCGSGVLPQNLRAHSGRCIVELELQS